MTIRYDALTGNEQALLLTLMAENRAVPNPELVKMGFRLTPTRRNELVGHGLVEVAGRPMQIALDEDGWAMCGEIIAAGVVPPGSKTQGKAFYAVLRGLHRYLGAHQLQPSDVFGALESASAAPAEAPPPPVASLTGGSIDDQIRAAYARLVPRPGGWVGLARLRDEVRHAARTDVDGALRRLFRLPGVTLIPEENQKTLTQDDRAAAISIGDEDKHLIAIQP